MIEVIENDEYFSIKLNRPDKANSLTAGMLQELINAVAEASDRGKVLSISGEGKVFSAGADFDEATAGLATSPLWEKLSGAIADSPCFSIAALNGTLAGGAFGMALACDVRIAVPNAKFFYPVMRLGFLPQPSDPNRLARLIGPARAKMILMGGQKITAEEALSWGLVDRLVTQDELDKATRKLSEDVLGATREHALAIKDMLR